MTLEEKLSEADFYRKKVRDASNGVYPNLESKLFEIRCFASGYLSASASVYDYVLNYANRVFGLNLKDGDHWSITDFEKTALDTGNWGALAFAEWYRSKIESDKGMMIGLAFAESRRLNVHKRGAYEIGIDPKIVNVGLNGDGKTDPEKIAMDPNIFLTVEGFNHMKIDDACDTHFATVESFVDSSKEKIDEIQVAVIKGEITPPLEKDVEKKEILEKVDKLKKNKDALEKKIQTHEDRLKELSDESEENTV